ncbi:tail fiber assembly protein [Roseomonas sp. USHLN139]|uniref:tail fiber assembly protein n=1 Tax=Roseomonas sp. USHLN139 TaxID=3081298 RepID=UPI003B0152BE
MQIYYAASARGFYAREIHGDGMPPDAVEITSDEHAALLRAQAAGQEIAPGADGRPVATPPAEPAPEYQAEAARARRDVLLLRSDWTQVADAPLSTETVDAWRGYRQALRDLPDQAGFPLSISWPPVPN